MNKKILIVDDIESFRIILSSFLKDYEIYYASNGQEAYDNAIKIKPDLIITDNNMPIMTGTELIKKIQANHDLSHIPMILMSSHYVNVGCPFIYKPFEKDEIQNLVFELLNNNVSFYL